MLHRLVGSRVSRLGELTRTIRPSTAAAVAATGTGEKAQGRGGTHPARDQCSTKSRRIWVSHVLDHYCPARKKGSLGTAA